MNRELTDSSLVLTWNKPFDLLAQQPDFEGGRGDWRKFEPTVRPFGAAFNDPLPGHLRRAQGMVVA
jgi:hypothetical protein